MSRALLVLPLCAVALAGCGGTRRPEAQTTTRPVAKPAPDTRAVPILTYHELAAPRRGAAFPELYVQRATFAAQIRLLSRAGYRAVTLGRVFAAWHGRGRLPARPIVLSFDDGYPSDISVALPILRARRWPGVLNLQVGNLEARKVRELLAAGWEVDAHTFTHPNLTHVGAARLWREVNGSRRAIRRTYAIPVDFFCYPAGRYDAVVIAAVRRAGYEGATTTNLGLARRSHPFTLSRVRVSAGQSPAGLLRELAALERRAA